jgi:hypothetical protein
VVGEKYILDFTSNYYAKCIWDHHKVNKRHHGVVNEVQQLDKNIEMTPVTCTRASYYIKEETYMFTLMVEGVEYVFLSRIIRELSTKSKLFFAREISISFPQIHRKCFNAGLHTFLFFIDLYWRLLVGLLCFSGAIIHQSPWSKFKFRKVMQIN